MTITVAEVRDLAPTSGIPSRRTLVGLATAVLAGYVVMFATGSDLQYDTSLKDIEAAYRSSEGAVQLSAYTGMAFVALLLFFGAALRHALRASGRTWLTDVTFYGFGALAATIASWVVTDVALWKAVEYGDQSAIRTIATISDAGFLPLMASMIAIYLGTGLVAMISGALPRWLAIASLVIGIAAPLGPLGFIGALLLPIWVITVSICVRLEGTPS